MPRYCASWPCQNFWQWQCSLAMLSDRKTKGRKYPGKTKHGSRPPSSPSESCRCTFVPQKQGVLPLEIGWRKMWISPQPRVLAEAVLQRANHLPESRQGLPRDRQGSNAPQRERALLYAFCLCSCRFLSALSPNGLESVASKATAMQNLNSSAAIIIARLP